ncbi:MAG: FAD-binding protein [bacterium]|nr:FAD-binding protein [bacterium]
MDKEIIKKLETIVGEERISTSPVELFSYGADSSIHHKPADVVLQIRSAKEVSEILKLANQHKIPVIPRGSGSALCGQTVPIHGGIILDFQRMNTIKEVKHTDCYVVVEPGVVYKQLNDHLAKKKFFFPPGPGSGDIATIGGMVISNASGVNAVKYGATRDYVLGLEIVLPTGEIIHSGTRTVKNSSGYQIDRLMAASEGTLGVVTEIILKVVPLPQHKALTMAVFDDIEKTGQAVADIIAYPLIPAGLELMDSICIKAVNKATDLNMPEAEGILLIILDGHPAQVADQVKIVSKICSDLGATGIKSTEDPKEMLNLQKGRKQMIPSLSRYKEGSVTVMLADDMGVPPSKIPKAIKAFHDIAAKYDDIFIPTYGHAGDGNLHTKFIMDPTRPEVWKDAEKAVEEVFDAVLELDGTITGEHGVAITKAPYFKKERKDSLDAMKTIKKALDPNNILNPGKIMDWDREGIVHYLRYVTLPREKTKGMEKLDKWESELNACTFCAFCKSVCPVFDDIGWDSVSPKGQNISSYFLMQGQLKPDEDVVKSLYRCTMCLDCTRRCPTSIPTADIVAAARTGLVESGFRNPMHEQLVKSVEESGNIYGEMEHIKPQEGEVLLFLGCGYQQRPNTVKKFVRILDKLGVKAKIGDESCCGYPLKILGYNDAYEKQRKQFLEMIKAGQVITFCPTCYMFIHEEYEETHKPKHILEVIAEKLEERELKSVNMEVTYHDPCHLARGAGIVDAPRRILAAIGADLKEMSKNKNTTTCCGGGGGILTSDADLSGRLGAERVEDAFAAGVNDLVTICPTCELSLRTGAKNATEGNDRKMKIHNMMDLVWKAVK